MTDSPDPASSWERPAAPALVAAAAVVVVLVGMHFLADVIFLLSLSAMVTLLLHPVGLALQRRGVSSGMSLALALGLYLLVIAVVVVLLVLGVYGFQAQLPEAEPKVTDGLAGIIGARDQATTISSTVFSLLATLADALLGAAVLVGLSVFVVIYLLLEARRGNERLLWAFPGRPGVVGWAHGTADQLRSYLLTRVLLGAIAAVLDAILLVVLGIPSALLWGVLSFLMSFVPNVGFFIALIPPTILGYALGGVPTALFVAIGYVVINLTIDYAVQPRLMANAVNLSAVVVTLSVFFWAAVLGPRGAMLAVPLTVIAANLADSFGPARPVARLLADIVPRSKSEPQAEPEPEPDLMPAASTATTAEPTPR